MYDIVNIAISTRLGNVLTLIRSDSEKMQDVKLKAFSNNGSNTQK